MVVFITAVSFLSGVIALANSLSDDILTSITSSSRPASFKPNLLNGKSPPRPMPRAPPRLFKPVNHFAGFVDALIAFLIVPISKPVASLTATYISSSEFSISLIVPAKTFSLILLMYSSLCVSSTGLVPSSCSSSAAALSTTSSALISSNISNTALTIFDIIA